MKKIGLITYYNNNYGSTLQCYATKTYIEKNGFACEVLAHSNKKRKDRISYKVKNACRQLPKMVLRRGYYVAYKSQKRVIEESSKKGSTMSAVSKRKLTLFVDSVLQPRECSDTVLKSLAKRKDYVAFIAGSDQIWSGAWPVNPFYFLDFAPEEKKIAFAASIGTDRIEAFNCKDFKHQIGTFRKVSIRETTGVQSVKEQLGIEAENICDPTVLLSDKEWKDFASFNQVPQEHYVLAHFIDPPNEQALKTINLLTKNGNLKVVVFAYHHSNFSSCENIILLDGDSRDYVGLIHNAKFICTDSFHTTVMAIYFARQFFIFNRQYNHKNSQVSRLISVLQHYQCENRFIEEYNPNEISQLSKMEISGNMKDIVFEDRKNAADFLNKAIKEIDVREPIEHPYLKKDDCVACGACVAVCSKNAIHLESNIYGTSWPVIDTAKCVTCNQCEMVCRINVTERKERQKRKAFIAFNKNNLLRAKSASGGVFSEISDAYIKQGGIVVGAAFCYDDAICVRHLIAHNEDELQPLLKSKYVRSDCTESYKLVKAALTENKCVLFSGTSCQVDGLYRYLKIKKVDCDKLSTIDLICHGTPDQKCFSEYVEYLEDKYCGNLSDFSFRQKDANGKSAYIIKAVFKANNKKKEIMIPLVDSYYYKYFLMGENYRENCYYCQFATINKPADITIGDYFEAKEDYPELFQPGNDLEKIGDISCIIVNTTKGEKLLKKYGEDLYLKVAEIDKVQASHSQLCKPSMYSSTRLNILKTYRKSGTQGVIRQFEREKKKILMTKKLLSVIKK